MCGSVVNELLQTSRNARIRPSFISPSRVTTIPAPVCPRQEYDHGQSILSTHKISQLVPCCEGPMATSRPGGRGGGGGRGAVRVGLTTSTTSTPLDAYLPASIVLSPAWERLYGFSHYSIYPSHIHPLSEHEHWSGPLPNRGEGSIE